MVCFVCGVVVGFVVCERAFSSSRAVTSSICLASMASLCSVISSVCGSIVFTICVDLVVGIENVVDLTSFPFLVGSTGRSGCVLI